MGTPPWFVSHTHMDHIAALPVYVARRRMMKMEPPSSTCPSARVRARAEDCCDCVSRLDRGRLPCDLRADPAGRRDRTVARAGRHGLRHDAHGAVAGLRRLGAAAQAQARVSLGLPGDQIRDLRLAGVDVTREAAAAAAGLPGRQLARRARRLPGDVRGRSADHGDDLRRPEPPQGEDPQVRPHAPGRLRGAARAVPERADHRRPLQHPLPPKPDSRDASSVRCPTCSTAGCTCGWNDEPSTGFSPRGLRPRPLLPPPLRLLQFHGRRGTRRS